MANLIEVKTSEGEIVLYEISESGEVFRGKDDSITQIEKSSSEILKNGIIPHCKDLGKVFNELKKLDVKPKNISTEFGFQIGASGNVFITKFSANASFKVKIDWDF